MKNQALFSSKDKSKKLYQKLKNYSLLQFLFGALRVKRNVDSFLQPGSCRSSGVRGQLYLRHSI